MIEPKYDEDAVNLGYLKKVISNTENDINNGIYSNVSKHYASKPQPPYHKGDTWIDGNNIIYTCIKDREIGIYTDSDWVTESGALAEAERKNKVFLRQPSNYNVGDMWILQSDTDHKAGKKGEILVSIAGRSIYEENDWIAQLGYGTIASINEVANNLNDAVKRIGITEEAIEDGIIITFYQAIIPEAKHIGDLWYVTENVDEFIKGKLYRYDGVNWQILNDPEITQAFAEANEARIVADGKIQSFYSAIAPSEDIGVGDLWIDTDDNNKLYRYNGTNWVAVYDTRIDEIIVDINTVTTRTTTIETDLGSISTEVSELSTTTKNNYISLESQLEGKASNTEVTEIRNSVKTLETATDYAIKIGEDLQVNGTSKVKTETGYTFDKDGLTIEKTDAETKSVLNEKGLEIKDATGSQDEVLLKAGYDEATGETIVKSKNMNVEKYLTVGKYSRIEDYEEGTGVFWIGG